MDDRFSAKRVPPACESSFVVCSGKMPLMAKSWQYPRWRRYAMQAAMWVILGVTVGMAALVNHSRRQALRVELGPPITSGPFTVRLPAKWSIGKAIAVERHSTM